MSVVKKLQNIIRKSKRPSACTAVIVAAGTASRMNGIDKVMAELSGEPVICHSIRAFQENTAVSEIIVVAREELLTPISRLCAQNGFDKVKMVAVGGATRAESVMAGLDQATNKTGLAAIHDGARPLVTQAILDDTIALAARSGAAAPAIPVKDTIKLAQNGIVVKTPKREDLFAVQTPQIFDFDLLRGALQQAAKGKIAITDDCSAVEAMGMKVQLSKGSDENIKITTPIDLILAKAILERRNEICG